MVTIPHLFTVESLFKAFVEDINADLSLMIFAILSVGLYLFLFLGSFSPINCKCIVALTGLFCVLFAYTSGFGFVYFCGG